MIVSIDVDAQKTFTPLCPAELPVAGGDTIAAELNAQAELADLRVMTKDAHSPNARWLVDNPVDMLKPTGLANADLTWVSHAIVGSEGFDLLNGLPDYHGYDYCVWKGVDPELHPYGACYHDRRKVEYRPNRMADGKGCGNSSGGRFGHRLLCQTYGIAALPQRRLAGYRECGSLPRHCRRNG